MSEEGFFFVSRGMLDHPIFAAEPLCEIAAWLWLIREAAWKERTVRVGRAVVDLKRGECAVSTRFLATRWKWSEAKVRRFLNKIKKAEMISTKTDALATHITICNYDEYQRAASASDAEPTQKRRKQEGNKGNKERKEGARAARLPADWVIPDDWLGEAVAEGMAVNRALASAERMKNWSLGAGKSGAKVDWHATWRNWYRKDLADRNVSPARDASGNLTNKFLFARG